MMPREWRGRPRRSSLGGSVYHTCGLNGSSRLGDNISKHLSLSGPTPNLQSLTPFFHDPDKILQAAPRHRGITHRGKQPFTQRIYAGLPARKGLRRQRGGEHVNQVGDDLRRELGMELRAPNAIPKFERLIGPVVILRQGHCSRRQVSHHIAVTLLGGKRLWYIGEKGVRPALSRQGKGDGPQFPPMSAFLDPTAKRLGKELITEANAIERN